MTAQSYVDKGNKAKTNEQKEENYNKALELEPDNMVIRRAVSANFFTMGRANRGTGAIRYFDRALELDPDNTELKKSIVANYISRLKGSRGSDRIAFFTKAIELDPDNLEIYFANGFALWVNEKNHSASLQSWEEISVKEPLYKVPANYLIFPIAPRNKFGFTNTNQFRPNNGIRFDNFSIMGLIGELQYWVVEENIVSSEAEKKIFLEKASQNLQKGFELDITQRSNNTQEAKTLYLMMMARVAFLMGDYAESLRSYNAFLNDSDIKFDKAGIAQARDVIQEKNLEFLAINNPNSAKAQYDWAYFLNFTKSNDSQAAIFYERALAIDPSFRVTQGFNWPPQAASNAGVALTERLEFSNFSLFYLLGQTFSNSNNTSEQEKSLAAFRRAYEIDITGGRNRNNDLRTIYLGQIARMLDRLNRRSEANDFYLELSKIANVTAPIAERVRFAGVPSYYVSARGNNNNNGLSAANPLRTLSNAFEKAAAGSIRRIVVIGTLNQQSEAGTSIHVFSQLGRNNNEILITGIPGAQSAERAVLSGAESKKSVLYINGTTRFENIEISGGEHDSEDKNGNGIFVSGTVTIGTGTVVRNNKGVGISILSGSCTLLDGEIRDNQNGGVRNNMGTFNMRGGTIRNNKGVNGGGVSNYGTFTMSGGTISNNTATEDGGGVYVSFRLFGDVIFTMTGGTISGNTARFGGAVFLSAAKEEFNLDGGTFLQRGGSITNNRARTGGGVVASGHKTRYDKTGGTVSGNNATHVFTAALPGSDNNVARLPGSLGSGR